ncbi:MAG TPA: hypothetical protein VIQ30_06130 [Pseudonocardia sp.]
MAFKQFGAGDVLTAADLNNYLMNQSVIACTSGTRPSSPVEGMVIFQTDTDSFLFWTGSAWKRFARDIETSSTVEDFEGANDTSTSTTYIPGTIHGVAFVAPPSGQVRVSFSGWIGSNAVAGGVVQAAFMSDYVRLGTTIGSGADVMTPTDDRAIFYSLTNTTAGFKYEHSSMRHLVTGLAAGSSYNVTTVFRSAVAASAAVNKRWILVEPVL